MAKAMHSSWEVSPKSNVGPHAFQGGGMVGPCDGIDLTGSGNALGVLFRTKTGQELLDHVEQLLKEIQNIVGRHGRSIGSI